MPTRNAIERATAHSPHPTPVGGAPAAGPDVPSGSAASFIDRPFGCPLDVVLDVPVPPSVNRTRKIHWPGHRALEAWRKQAGLHLIANGQYRAAQKGIERYELVIVFDRKLCRRDPDNPIKAASDFLKSINIIKDDSPQFAEQITIKWGEAPAGCRLIVKPIEGEG